MNEDELTQEDIDAYNQRRQKEYDEYTKGNEELQKRQIQEGKKKKRQEQFKKRNKRTQTDSEGNTLTRSPGQVFTGGEQVIGTSAPDTDMRTGEMIPNDAEEDQFGNILDPNSGFRTTLAIGTEVGLNTILDLFSADPTQLTQIFGAQGINALAQRIRGGEFSRGEMIASGIASLLPGGAQARSLTGSIVRTGIRGGVSGAIETGAADLIDTGEIDPERVAEGAVIGTAFGGLFGVAAGQKETQQFFKRLKARMGNNLDPNTAVFTPEELSDMGIGEPLMFARRRKYNKAERADLENQGQGNIFKSFAADPRLGQTDDQMLDVYKNYRIQKGDPYVDPKKAFKRGLVTRQIQVKDLEPILKEHPEIPKDKINEYIQFVNRESRAKDNRLGKTITFLNDAYINGKLGLKKLGNLRLEDLTPNKVRTGSPQEIAEDMSAILGQNITVKTLDNIIQEKGSIPVEISDKVVMQVTDLKSLTKAYMARINRFTDIPAFERGHVFAAKNIFEDPNIADLSDFKGNLEPEIARSIYNIVDDKSFDDLLKGVDLEGIIKGNRSRAAKSDPDKVVGRLLGTDYGLRESFLNFVYPQRALANKIPADAKAAFIDDYVEEMEIALRDYDDGGTVGVNTLDFIRAAVLKKIIPKYETLNDELIEGLITTTDMVTGRNMTAEVDEALKRNLVNPQEIRRKGEAK
tara:strand:- start:189 stop:2261 length:2073 start_codon:yes stop_codon:yes gene_type:complete